MWDEVKALGLGLATLGALVGIPIAFLIYDQLALLTAAGILVAAWCIGTMLLEAFKD